MIKEKVPWNVSKFKTFMNLLSNPIFKFPRTKKMIVVKKYQFRAIMSHYDSWKHIIQVKSEPNDVQQKYLLNFKPAPFFYGMFFFTWGLLLVFSLLQGSVYYILESRSVSVLD